MITLALIKFALSMRYIFNGKMFVRTLDNSTITISEMVNLYTSKG